MQQSIFQEIKNYFLQGNMLSKLIFVNVGIFIFANLINLVFFLLAISPDSQAIIHWLGISSNPGVIIARPWTIITYMFTHLSLFHILFNMIVFYVGGRLFCQFIGEKRLLGTYIIGGLVGGLFFILSYNFFPVFREYAAISVAIGASASVMAIFVAIATYMPNYHLPLILLGRVRLKYIAIFFVIIDLISIDKGNSGGHIAHLGGAAYGFLYIMLLKQGHETGLFFNTIFEKIQSFFRPKPKMRVKYSKQRPVTDDEYNKEKVETQKKIDKILDKISKHGYESLSKEEKELLFKMGK